MHHLSNANTRGQIVNLGTSRGHSLDLPLLSVSLTRENPFPGVLAFSLDPGKGFLWTVSWRLGRGLVGGLDVCPLHNVLGQDHQEPSLQARALAPLVVAIGQPEQPHETELPLWVLRLCADA